MWEVSQMGTDENDQQAMPDEIPLDGENVLSVDDVPGAEWEDIKDDLSIGGNPEPNREERTTLGRLEAYDDLPRDERILDKVSPSDYLGEWDPAEDEQLHRFIAMREAGLERDIDVTDNHEVWLELTDRIDCRQLGYKMHLGPGNFFQGPDHDFGEIVSLHRTEDWERLKKLAEFDPEEWPMESLADLVEEVHERND